MFKIGDLVYTKPNKDKIGFVINIERKGWAKVHWFNNTNPFLVDEMYFPIESLGSVNV